MKKKILLWIAVLFQICILGFIIVQYSYVLQTGKEVLVRIQPIDPRDLLRGDYVWLGYDISNYSGGLLQGTDVTQSQEVYLIPRLDDNKVVGIKSMSFEQPLGDEIFFKAKISNIVGTADMLIKIGDDVKSYKDPYYSRYDFSNYMTGSKVYVNFDSTGDISYIYSDKVNIEGIKYGEIIKLDYNIDSISLDYGADRFFVKEGKGRDLQDNIIEKQAWAVWKVSKSGKIVLEGIMIDGEFIK